MTGPAMAALPHPHLRRVVAQVLSPLGWLQATLHVPAEMPLLVFLADPNPVLALTHVRVPKEPDPVPFMAIDREAIILVAPAFAQELAGSTDVGTAVARDVACFLPEGILRGRVEVPVGLRLSDQLRAVGEFLVLRHGLFTPYGETLQSPSARSLPAVVLRRRYAVGITEAS